MPRRERTFAKFLECSGDELRSMCIDYNICSVTQLLKFFCLSKPNSRQIILAREHLSACGIDPWVLPALGKITSSTSPVATYAHPDTSIRPPKRVPPLGPLPMPPKVTKPSRGLPGPSEGISVRTEREDAKGRFIDVLKKEIELLQEEIDTKRALIDQIEALD